MTTITVRQLNEDQWPEWRSLRLTALATDPSAFGSTLAEWSGPGDVEDRWRRRLRGVALNLLADLDGQTVGMASASMPEDGTAEILSMWVAPQARGRGVGDALVVAALRWIRANGGLRAALDVREANGPAIALYRRHGFCDDGWASEPDDPHPERRMVRDFAE